MLAVTGGGHDSVVEGLRVHYAQNYRKLKALVVLVGWLGGWVASRTGDRSEACHQA